MNFVDYLRDVRAEMRHVSFPSKQQTLNFTIIVLVISIVTGVFLGLLDFGFQYGLQELFTRFSK